jgi:hypothetical protein
MNLPNYFLADLPPEATLSPDMLGEACRTLRRNRERYLVPHSTHSLVNLLCSVAKSWLDPEYPLRKLALEQGPAATGFSSPTLANGLDSFFKQLTPEAFQALLEQDLGHPQRLDHLSATPAERQFRRSAVATGPELLVHITAGNLPSPALSSIVLGVLVRSAQFVKCASGSSLVPRLFAHSLYDAEPKLGACLEIAEWQRGQLELEQTLFEQADCLTATGSDQAVADIRQRLPAETRFLAYGHRVSFAFVSHEALSVSSERQLVAQAATDIIAWNQLGCLSPHVIYIQQGGSLGPEQFAEVLARELERREELEPRGELPTEIAAAIASRRALYEVRAAHAPDTTRHWCSKNSTSWTVVYEADPRFQVSCLHRFIYVKSVKDLTEALQAADSIRGKVSTVGLAAPPHQVQDLATELARWGASRVCPLGQMQQPPLTWRHDGRPALRDLVTWTDWET